MKHSKAAHYIRLVTEWPMSLSGARKMAQQRHNSICFYLYSSIEQLATFSFVTGAVRFSTFLQFCWTYNEVDKYRQNGRQLVLQTMMLKVVAESMCPIWSYGRVILSTGDSIRLSFTICCSNQTTWIYLMDIWWWLEQERAMWQLFGGTVGKCSRAWVSPRGKIIPLEKALLILL